MITSGLLKITGRNFGFPVNAKLPMHEFALWKRHLAIALMLILATAPAFYNQLDRSGVGEASARPDNGERVASRRRAATGGYTHAARPRATADRIRAERGVGARG